MDEHGWISKATFSSAMASFTGVMEEWKCDPTRTYLVRCPIQRSIEYSFAETDATWTNEANIVWDDPDTVVQPNNSNTTSTLWTFSIVFSPIWKVPVLYFTVVDATSGVPCPRERILASLHHLDDATACSYEEHPVTGVPSCFLHPCRTAERLEQLLRPDEQPSPSGAVLLWSWWVLMAPIVGFPIDPETHLRVRNQLMASCKD